MGASKTGVGSNVGVYYFYPNPLPLDQQNTKLTSVDARVKNSINISMLIVSCQIVKYIYCFYPNIQGR